MHHIGKHWRSYWVWKCDCGKEKIILGSGVVSGNTKSCGCLSSDVKKARRISRNHSEITAIILGYKRHALSRGYDWMLSRLDVERIIIMPCHYCGSPPGNRKKTKNSIGCGMLYSGIDRIDNTKGYFPENVVPACSLCNYAKSNTTIEEFKNWAVRLGLSAMADQWGSVSTPIQKELF